MKINGKEYKLSYTGETLLIYKEEFGKDMILEANRLSKDFNFVSIYEFVWAMAKSGNDDVPSFRDFMKSMSVKEITNPKILQEVNECMGKDGKTTKEVKKKIFQSLMNK